MDIISVFKQKTAYEMRISDLSSDVCSSVLGLGQEIEIPMFETLVSFTMIEHLCGSIFDPTLGPPEYPRVTSEARRPYRTRDGYIGVMIYNDKHWRALFAALGDPERLIGREHV